MSADKLFARRQILISIVGLSAGALLPSENAYATGQHFYGNGYRTGGLPLMTGPRLPVNISKSFGTSKTDPTIKAHHLAHDAIHGIINTFDAGLGTAAKGQVLTWNGAAYAPATPGAETLAAAEAGTQSIEDASHEIYALAPSPESGLQAIAADAATDDAPRIQAMLNYLKQTYGGGVLNLPPGRTSNCNSTITIPAGVQVRGSVTSVWDFWFAGSAVTAIVISDKEFTPIVDSKSMAISGMPTGQVTTRRPRPV